MRVGPLAACVLMSVSAVLALPVSAEPQQVAQLDTLVIQGGKRDVTSFDFLQSIDVVVVQPDGSVRKADAIDYVDQYELGLKYRSGGFGLFVTGFYAKTQEQNFEATTQQFFDRTYTAKGIELEAAYRRGIFDLRAGATWTDAEISKDNITPANEGNTPRRQADLVYQITPALDFDVARVGLNIVGTTKAYAQDSNELIFPAYTQVNAFVNFRPVDNIELSLNANNLFNAKGITESEEGSITAGVDNFIRARAINGRTISASVRFDF